MPPIYIRDGNANPCQFATPVLTIVSYNLGTSASYATLAENSYYIVIATKNMWWRWITPSYTAATVGDSDSGLWPANEPINVYTGSNTYFGFIADSVAGYVTFYKVYGNS